MGVTGSLSFLVLAFVPEEGRGGGSNKRRQFACPDRRADGRTRKTIPSLFFPCTPPFSQTLSKTAAAAWLVFPYFSTVRLLILSLRPSVGASDFCSVWKKKRKRRRRLITLRFPPCLLPLPPLRNVPFLRLLPRRKTRETTCGFKRRRREKRRSLARLLSFYSCIYTCMKFTQERIHRRKPLPEMTFRNSLIATEFPRLGDDCPEKKSQNR